MEVLAKVIAVDLSRNPDSKLKAKVKLLVDNPFDAIEINLFEFHQKEGVVARFESLTSKTAIVPVEVDLYKGKLQYGLAFGCTPELYGVDKSTGEIVDDVLKTPVAQSIPKTPSAVRKAS